MATQKSRTVNCPSGVVLEVNLAPFAASKALYEAVLIELKGLKLGKEFEMETAIKDLFCAGFTSPRVQSALQACWQRCLYDGVIINDESFEPADRRQDYMVVCAEVVQENVFPFVKNLFADFKRYAEALTASIPKSK